MPFDFDQAIERRKSDCLKWDSIDENMLPMWVADMDFACPPEVIEALTRRAEHGVFGYSYPGDAYYHSIMDWMGQRHGWNIEREWILPCPGVVSALDIAIRALTEAGDRILIQTPVYHPFFSVVQNNQRILVENELIFDGNRYTIDFSNLEKQLASGVKLMLLCSPHNPVGRVWTNSELNQIAELCRKYEVIIVADEIHSDLVYPQFQHQVLANLGPAVAARSVICTAANKTFNIAGIQAANIIIPDQKLRKRFRQVLNTGGLALPNVFAVTALTAAYKYGASWLDELLIYLQANLACLGEFVRENLPGVSLIEPEATYLAWLDFRGLQLSEEKIKELITQAGLVFNPGAQFGLSGTGFQRLNFACPRSTLIDGLNRLAGVLL